MLPIQLTPTEQDDVIELCRANPTFHQYIYRAKRDYTNEFMRELRDVVYGKIPRNFVLNIKAGIGRQRGVFKSSFGNQLAITLDPQFNVKERVAFTTYDLNEKIKKYAGEKQIFLLDEQVRDLKYASEQRLANIIDACRERQLCFIMIGVQEAITTISDYQLERLGESEDKYLPEKTVAFCLKKKLGTSPQYRGFIKWELTPLTGNKLGSNATLTPKIWAKFWEEYMLLKRHHQQKAIDQQLTSFNFKDASIKLRKLKDFEACTNPNGILNKQKLKNLIYIKFPDVTNEERKMIYGELT